MCFACYNPIPDPIQGDPDAVSGYAKAYDDTAKALRDAVTQLKALANGNVSIGESVDEVRDRANEGVTAADAVAVRYEGAATAYTQYATALATAQSTAESARQSIDTNNQNGHYWRTRRTQLEYQRLLDPTDTEVLEDLVTATTKALTYDSAYATYLDRYQTAVENLDQAARDAIRTLHNAAEQAGLNDKWYEAFVGDLANIWDLASKYLGPVLEALREVLKVLKEIVDILALIVTVLSIFIPALAPLALALTALSAILAVGVFLCSLVLFAMGRESLGTVIADGIGAVVSVVTAKLGGAGNNLFRTVGENVAETGVKLSTAFAQKQIIVTTNIATRAGNEALSAILPSTMSANAAPFQFVFSEGLDFTLGSSREAWNMDGADPGGLIAGLLDQPTLGIATPVLDAVTLPDAIFGEGGVTERFGEVGDVWGQIGAVPSR